MPFGWPHFVGTTTIVFAAQGDLWTIPASADNCSFPQNATLLTTDGTAGDPAWTSATLANPIVLTGDGHTHTLSFTVAG